MSAVELSDSTVARGRKALNFGPREVAPLARMGLEPNDALAASMWPRPFIDRADSGGTADVVTYDPGPAEDAGELARPAAVVAGGLQL